MFFSSVNNNGIKKWLITHTHLNFKSEFFCLKNVYVWWNVTMLQRNASKVTYMKVLLLTILILQFAASCTLWNRKKKFFKAKKQRNPSFLGFFLKKCNWDLNKGKPTIKESLRTRNIWDCCSIFCNNQFPQDHIQLINWLEK